MRKISRAPGQVFVYNLAAVATRVFGSVRQLPHGVGHPVRQPSSLVAGDQAVCGVGWLFSIPVALFTPLHRSPQHGNPGRPRSTGNFQQCRLLGSHFSECTVGLEINAPAFSVLKSERWRWSSSSSEGVGQEHSRDRWNPGCSFETGEQTRLQQKRDRSQRATGKLKPYPRCSHLRRCGGSYRLCRSWISCVKLELHFIP